jgi:hypothetical protein
MIQLGPILMVCRYCNARPGDPCRSPTLETFHAARKRDAARASDLLEDPAYSRKEHIQRILADHVKSPKPGTVPWHNIVTELLQ